MDSKRPLEGAIIAAVYHPGVVLTIPKYDLGHPTNAANVIAWQTAASGLTVAQLTAVQSAFDGSWGTAWRNIAATGNRYMGSWVVDMSSATGNQVTNALFVPQAGLAAASSAGDQVAALISLHTPTRYRGGHGRVYVGGLSTAQIATDGQNLTPSAQTAIASLWNTTASAMLAISGTSGGPYNPIVWHKHLASAPNTIEVVTGTVAQLLLATQRRRLRKVTRHHRRI